MMKCDTYSTNNNEDLLKADLTGITKIYLNEGKKLDLSFIRAAREPAIIFLHCEFRPDFTQLPETLKELSIQTQYEVWRKDLPKSLKKLHIATPNCNPITFELEENPQEEVWDCEYFYISNENFGRYNSFKRSFFDSESDNIHKYGSRYTRWFDRHVDGDPVESGEDNEDAGTDEDSSESV